MNFFDYFENVVGFPVSSRIILKSEIDGNKVFSDKCFIGTDYRGNEDTAAFKIDGGTVVFERCIFKNFTYPLMFCKGYSRVIFKKCYFENINDGITATDRVVIEMYHCRFNKVSESCLNFMKNSSFTIKNSKFLTLTGSGIVMVDNSFGCIEESSFYANKGCGPFSFGFRLQGKNDLKLYKCKFQDLGYAIASSKRGTVFAVQCQFKRNRFGCLAIGFSGINLYFSRFTNHEDICCNLKDESYLSIYESEFKENFNECIVAEDKSILKIYNSNFDDNIGNCIDLSDEANGTVSECSIGNSNCAGIFLKVRSLCEVSKCKIFDNHLGNVIITHLAQGNFTNNEIFYDKPSFLDAEQININCCEASKCHLDNNKIYGYGKRKTVVGIVSSDTANVFINKCLLKTLWAVALYEDNSSIYITDSVIKDFYDVYAQGDDTATLGNVRCRYENLDDEYSLMEV